MLVKSSLCCQAAKRAGEARGKDFMREAHPTLLIICSRRGNYFNGVGSMCLHASNYISTNHESITDCSTQAFIH